MTTALITHPDCIKHVIADYHPESPDRLKSIEKSLRDNDLYDALEHFEAPMASREHIELVHDKEHVDFIHANAPSTGSFAIDLDTAMNPSTLNAAYRAAGAIILAVDLTLEQKVTNAFCSVRPPGHHAEIGQAMGFCIFNNIAIGASYALTKEQIKRVAIIDFDVHHGNGTEDIFRSDERILICSSFQHPCYPGKYFERNHDRIINLTLTPGSGSELFRDGVERMWAPAIERFKPDFFFISAGFDAHYLDPLAQLELDEEDYSWVTKKIVRWADQYAEGRIVSTLEGGYHLEALGSSVSAHVKSLLEA